MYGTEERMSAWQNGYNAGKVDKPFIAPENAILSGAYAEGFATAKYERNHLR